MLKHDSTRPHKKIIRRRRRKNKRHFHWYTIVLGLIGIVVLFFGVNALMDAYSFYSNSYSNQGASHLSAEKLRFKQPVNVLIMGEDVGDHRYPERPGKTDELMMNTLDPANNRMRITNVPSNSIVHVDGNREKIDSVYGQHGAAYTQHYMQHWLHVPVNYYMKISMLGLERLTRRVGGVRVNPPLTFSYRQVHVKKNHPIRLRGRAAMDYCLMAKQDPRGTYGRDYRQRQVLFQLIHQVTKPRNMALHPGYARYLTHYVKTNMSIPDLIRVNSKYRGCLKNRTASHYQGRRSSKDKSVHSYEVLYKKSIRKQGRIIRKLLYVKA